MKEQIKQKDSESYTVAVSLNPYQLIMGAFLLSYFVLIVQIKGYFSLASDKFSLATSLVGVILRYLLKIPLSIIDLLPVLTVAAILALLYLGHSIKMLYASLLIPLFIGHFPYFILSFLGFELSMSFWMATGIVVLLTLYILVTNEEKERNRKPLFSFSIPLRIHQYNVVFTIVMAVMLLIALFIPFVVPSREINLLIEGSEEVGKVNTHINQWVLLSKGSVGMVMVVINWVMFVIKIPFIIGILTAIFKLYRNKQQLFSLPKRLILFGGLTFGLIPYLIQDFLVVDVIRVHTLNQVIFYLLCLWALFELVYIRKADQQVLKWAKKVPLVRRYF